LREINELISEDRKINELVVFYLQIPNLTYRFMNTDVRYGSRGSFSFTHPLQAYPKRYLPYAISGNDAVLQMTE
jgi:hypothetical protein